MRINLKILSIIISLLVIAAISAKSQPSGSDPNARDTIFISSVTSYTSSNTGIVPINFYNDQPLAGVEITLTYNSPDIMIDSFSFVGGRVANYSLKGADQLSGSSITIYAYAMSEGLIPEGTGMLGYLFCSFIPNISQQLVTFDTLTLDISDREYSTAFSDETANAYTPIVLPGVMTIQTGSCCLGDRGNVDNSPDDLVDISDLVFLVTYMFNDGPAPTCPFESNIDGSVDEVVDISDLVYLVTYMFNDGPPPPSCP